MFLTDYLRWPFSRQGTIYQEKKQVQVQTVIPVKHFDTDSMGQLSGWVDRKPMQNVLSIDKGPVDLQLPESFFNDRLQPSSIDKLDSGPKNYGTQKIPRKANVKNPEASKFEQVLIWQPYGRETRMPFSNMPTRY